MLRLGVIKTRPSRGYKQSTLSSVLDDLLEVLRILLMTFASCLHDPRSPRGFIVDSNQCQPTDQEHSRTITHEDFAN